MAVALTILAWIGIVLGTLVGLILLVPWHARARGRASGLWGTGHLRASWGWFVVVLRVDPGRGARIKLFGIPIKRIHLGAKKRKDDPAEEDDRGEEAKDKGDKAGPSFLQLWRNRPVLWRAFRRLLGTLHLRGWLTGRLGLDDPADTAMVDLALWQLRERVRAVDWRVGCDYADEVLELEGQLGMWIWPIQVVWVGLFTWLNRDVRNALRAKARPGARAG